MRFYWFLLLELHNGESKLPTSNAAVVRNLFQLFKCYDINQHKLLPYPQAIDPRQTSSRYLCPKFWLRNQPADRSNLPNEQTAFILTNTKEAVLIAWLVCPKIIRITPLNSCLRANQLPIFPANNETVKDSSTAMNMKEDAGFLLKRDEPFRWEGLLRFSNIQVDRVKEVHWKVATMAVVICLFDTGKEQIHPCTIIVVAWQKINVFQTASVWISKNQRKISPL